VLPSAAEMIHFTGTKVRFVEDYRPEQVRWGAVGVVVDTEDRLSECWVRARFGDFIQAVARGMAIRAGALRMRQRAAGFRRSSLVRSKR
jgi:hypothetical protein